MAKKFLWPSLLGIIEYKHCHLTANHNAYAF